VTACDTDSIFFKKYDGSFFTKEERAKLLSELNNLMPEKIRWELNGCFQKIITLAAKNYVMVSECGAIKYKGSALKSSKTEPALKEFIHKIIDTILEEKHEYLKIYEEYVNEILNIKDITRWASKKTLTSTTYESERANETKIINAIEGTEYKEGDRIYVYFDLEGNLKLVENFNNDHDIPRLLKKLHSTSKVFDAIIPKGTFLNYSLKKNQELLNEIKIR
jgi:hypothetical protein